MTQRAQRRTQSAPPASPGAAALRDLVYILAEQAVDEDLARLAAEPAAAHDRRPESE